MLAYQHEGAYLLAKGRPPVPADPTGDVIPSEYTGNRLHPTQKPVSILRPLVRSFCQAGGLVLDPFAGSGSTLVAAASRGRAHIGIELDPAMHATARARLRANTGRLAARVGQAAASAATPQPRRGALSSGLRPARGRAAQPWPAALGAVEVLADLGDEGVGARVTGSPGLDRRASRCAWVARRIAYP